MLVFNADTNAIIADTNHTQEDETMTHATPSLAQLFADVDALEATPAPVAPVVAAKTVKKSTTPKDTTAMTRSELIAYAKANRTSTKDVALNAKTTVLQAWYDVHSMNNAHVAAAAVVTVEPTATEVDEACAVEFTIDDVQKDYVVPQELRDPEPAPSCQYPRVTYTSVVKPVEYTATLTDADRAALDALTVKPAAPAKTKRVLPGKQELAAKMDAKVAEYVTKVTAKPAKAAKKPVTHSSKVTTIVDDSIAREYAQAVKSIAGFTYRSFVGMVDATAYEARMQAKRAAQLSRQATVPTCVAHVNKYLGKFQEAARATLEKAAAKEIATAKAYQKAKVRVAA